MRGAILSPAALLGLLVSTAAGHGLKPSPTPEKVTSFQWRYPFEPEALEPYTHACEAEQKFPAKQYTLHELMEPPPHGLGPWASGLKKFFQGRDYPGGWAGWDRHLHDRSILKMEYADLPAKVRQWIEEQEKGETDGKGLFAVFKKPEEADDTIEDTTPPSPGDRSADQDLVAIFAPGAMYSVLPLWVAEGSACAGKTVIPSYQVRADLCVAHQKVTLAICPSTPLSMLTGPSSRGRAIRTPRRPRTSPSRLRPSGWRKKQTGPRKKRWWRPTRQRLRQRRKTRRDRQEMSCNSSDLNRIWRFLSIR